MTLHDADTGLRPGEPTPPEPLRPPTPGGISMRPAMIVLGLAVLILVVFVAIGILSSQSPAPVNAELGPTAGARASPCGPCPAADLLSPIVAVGRATDEHPSTPFPSRWARCGSRTGTTARQAGQFDSQVAFRSDDSQGALLAFFAADMKLQGWQVFDRGPAANDPGALEVLGKLAGSDGYYWEMGAVIPPTTFSAGGPAHGQTDFTIRLFQVSDAD